MSYKTHKQKCQQISKSYMMDVYMYYTGTWVIIETLIRKQTFPSLINNTGAVWSWVTQKIKQ